MNSTAPIALGITYGLIALIFLVFTFRGGIFQMFNLVDKRTMIGEETVMEKLNAMMVAGDVSLYASSWGAEKTFRVSLSYQGAGKEESITNSFRSSNINDAIEEAYKWSVERGFVKEEIVSPIPDEQP